MGRFLIFSFLYLITLHAKTQDILLYVTDMPISDNFTVLKRIDYNKYILRTNGTPIIKLDPNSILEAPVEWKFTQRFLDQPEKLNTQISIKVLDTEVFLEVSHQGITIIDVLEPWNVIILKGQIMNAKKLFEKDNNIVFVDIANRNIRVKEESLIRSHDLGLNSIERVHHEYPLLKGSGYNVSVKELSVDTSDIDIIQRSFPTSVTDTEVAQHATDMATLIGGSGNSDQTGLGVAREVNFTSASFSNLFPESSSYYLANSISVQNHSYGVGIENFYGLETQAYDQTTYDNPQLLHVFSAGNSGDLISEEGIYQNIEGFANITGTFKQSKNSLVVTSVDKNLNISDLNSRGPAYDGRIKPELTAFGGDGTSDAAALVSGASVLLKSHYETFYGKEPSASTVKSLLIAGAIDIGPKNIDFISGYGNLNLFNSLSIIDNDHVIEGEIMEGEELTFPLSIPTNTHYVRIALVWSDPPANPSDYKALVNNLDLKLENLSSGQVWYPWILNPYPNPDSLVLPAERGLDTLNNVELISIDIPEQGEYKITVSTQGSIPNNSQPFSISSYVPSSGSFSWIQPVGGKPLESGRSHYIRWNHTLTQMTGRIEIDYGSGNWITVQEFVELDQAYSEIQLKDTSTLARLRMDVSGTYYNSDPFFISPQTRQRIAVDCQEYFLMEWPSELNAISYQISSLKGKTMSPFAQLSDTLILISKADHQESYYSVTPIYENDQRGVRSLTIDYRIQGAECYIQSFFVSINDSNDAEIQLELGSIYQVENLIIEKSDQNDSMVLLSISSPEQLQYNLIDDKLNQGLNYYKAYVELSNGEIIESEELELLSIGEKNVLFFPNPVRQGEELTLVFKEADSSYKIFDSMGKVVVNNEIRGTVDSFTILNLQKGMYIYKVFREDQIIETGRLIVL